ncbi:MAG: DUF5131 family protein [Bradymonadaceae bacterium]
MSGIEWTTETWNPVTGCQRVSEGCQNCYAEQMAGRLKQMGVDQYEDVVDKPDGVDEWRWTGEITLVEHRLDKPLKWTHDNLRIFVDSMSDLFHEDVPFKYIAACFGVMAACPEHTFQILTKRPERMRQFFEWLSSETREVYGGDRGEFRGKFCELEAEKRLDGELRASSIGWPLPNVWLGVSAEHQKAADERIPPLLECPAAVHFVSAEPLLGSIDFSRIRNEEWGRYNPMRSPDLDWVIVGGESGKGARECSVDAIRSIAKQCLTNGVPVFVKQLGAVPVGDNVNEIDDPKGGDPDEWPDELWVREFPEGVSP